MPNRFHGQWVVLFAARFSVWYPRRDRRSEHILPGHCRIFFATGAATLCQCPDRAKFFQLRWRICGSATRWPFVPLLGYLLDIYHDNWPIEPLWRYCIQTVNAAQLAGVQRLSTTPRAHRPSESVRSRCLTETCAMRRPAPLNRRSQTATHQARRDSARRY